MNEYTPELFELIDAHGNKRNFELLDSVVMNGEQYYAMLPTFEDSEFLNIDLGLVILKVIEEDGEEILSSIDDEAEFDQISQYFAESLENFEDEFDYD
ncbi:MAG: DUF1292 domain-containing protein [Ruminococcus sp.]|nr:DUF1292 domain-containing protein [Ruminococcus sp.]